MYFSSFTDFIQMGNHGLYVWSAYSVTAVVMLGSLWYPIKRRKEFIKEQARQARREKQKHESH